MTMVKDQGTEQYKVKVHTTNKQTNSQRKIDQPKA